jgi:hypothetical protein
MLLTVLITRVCRSQEARRLEVGNPSSQRECSRPP